MFYPLSSILYFLSSMSCIFYLLSSTTYFCCSICWHLSFIFHLLSAMFYLMSSTFYLLSPVLYLITLYSSIFYALLSICIIELNADMSCHHRVCLAAKLCFYGGRSHAFCWCCPLGCSEVCGDRRTYATRLCHECIMPYFVIKPPRVINCVEHFAQHYLAANLFSGETRDTRGNEAIRGYVEQPRQYTKATVCASPDNNIMWSHLGTYGTICNHLEISNPSGVNWKNT